MSAAELKRYVMAMMDKLVKREIEQDNDYVFEESSSATASTERDKGGTKDGSRARPRSGLRSWSATPRPPSPWRTPTSAS